MKLYHATPKRNLESIRTNGLDQNSAQGKESLIWLHTASRRDWAIRHTINRHQCDISEVAIIDVNVPRSKLRRRWRGTWTTQNTATELKSIETVSEFTTETHPCQV